MTKREICERLVKMSSELLYVSLKWKLSTGYGRDHAKRAMELLEIAQELDPDLAAPETEETPKAEEKHPGVIARPGKDGEIEFCWCQKCYAQAAVVHNPFGDGENWSYCKKCGVSFRLKHKREEGEK